MKYVYAFEESLAASSLSSWVNQYALKGYRVHSLFPLGNALYSVLFEYKESEGIENLPEIQQD